MSAKEKIEFINNVVNFIQAFKQFLIEFDKLPKWKKFLLYILLGKGVYFAFMDMSVKYGKLGEKK